MKIVRNKDVATTVLEKECIVLDLRSGQYFGLENALKELWLEIENGCEDTNKILAKWKNEFDQSEEELTEILQEAIQQLTDQHLIKIEGI